MKTNRSFLSFVQVFSSLVIFLSSAAQAQVVSNSVDLFRMSESSTRGKTPAVVDAENKAVYEAFVRAENVDTDDAWMRPKNLNPRYASELLRSAETNPVVSLYEYDRYDPRNEGIGFCFGRALFIHLELAYRGFDRDSVRKAFVVGPMRTPDGGSWGWHVATIAQTVDARGQEEWLAIDPIAGVKPVLQWYREMYQSYSTDKKLKLYITLPTRFGPTANSHYDHDALQDPFYNNYFSDMMDWFEKQSGSGAYDSRQIREFVR
jgi:hypothetical protein